MTPGSRSSWRPSRSSTSAKRAFRAQQAQSRALPELVDKLQGMMQRMERRSQQLDQQLLGRQAQFQRDATQAYTALAQVSARRSRKPAAGARAAGERIRPVVESAMIQIVQESQRMREHLAPEAFEQRSATLLATAHDSPPLARSEAAGPNAQRKGPVAGSAGRAHGPAGGPVAHGAGRAARAPEESQRGTASPSATTSPWRNAPPCLSTSPCCCRPSTKLRASSARRPRRWWPPPRPSWIRRTRARRPTTPPTSPPAPSRWRAWAKPSASACSCSGHQRKAGGNPAAHRRRAQVHRAQRRAAGLLRGAGARGHRPEHRSQKRPVDNLRQLTGQAGALRADGARA